MAGSYTQGECSTCKQRVWINREAGSSILLCGRCKLGLPVLEEQMCSICFEPIEERIQFMNFSNHSWDHKRCRHLRNFCSSCLQGHVSSQLTDNFWNVRCPFVGSDNERCSYVLVEPDLKKVLNRPEHKSLLTQYETLRKADHGDYLREILSSHSSFSSENGSDCSSSERDGFELWAGNSCQACPRCRGVVRKEDGCDHMVCRCGTEFCFRCGGPYCETVGPPCVCSAMAMKQISHSQLGFWLHFHGRLDRCEQVHSESHN